MALVVARSALPILASSFSQSGGSAGSLALAGELAHHLWNHRDSLGGVAKFVYQGLKDQYFPKPPKGAKKGRVSGGRHVFLNGGYHGVKSPIYQSLAPVTMGMITHGLGFVDAKSMQFDDQPGMRVTFRTILAESICASSAASPIGFVDSMTLVNAASNPFSGLAGIAALSYINDYANAIPGRGAAFVLHPKCLSDRLLSISQLWCKYKFRHAQVHFFSTVSTATAGAVVASLVSTDVADGLIAASTGFVSTMSMPTSGSCSIWQHASLSELNYSGDRWWCLMDEMDGTTNIWNDTGGAPPLNNAVQMYLQVNNIGITAEAGNVTDAAITRRGFFVLDSVVDFQGICPIPEQTAPALSNGRARPRVTPRNL